MTKMVTTTMVRDDPQAFLPLKPRVFEALVVLAQGRLHGYALKQALYDRTSGRIDLGPGTLYRTIRSLEQDGLIRELDEPSESEAADHDRRRPYRITELGLRVLRAEAARLATLVAEVHAGLGQQ
jgi:DNA-binding PadR family transcriptional regulator